jgi:hypothetical protein
MYRQRSYENTKLQKCTDAPVVQDDKNTDAQEGDSDDQEDYTELEAYGGGKGPRDFDVGIILSGEVGIPGRGLSKLGSDFPLFTGFLGTGVGVST